MRFCSKLLVIGLALVLGGCSGPSSSSEVTSANVTAEAAADVTEGAVEEATRTEAGDAASMSSAPASPSAGATLPAGEEDSQALPLSPVAAPELEGRQLLVEWSADFEVKSAAESARAAEDLARKYGGYVARTDIYTLGRGTSEFAQGGQLTTLHRYTRQAELRLRVPRDRLAAFTDELQREVVFLGESHLSATDITLDILRRSWAEALARDKAAALAAQRVNADKADQQEANLKAIEREFAARKQQNADALAQLELQRRLELSAVSLTLTQPELSRRTTRPDPAALARAYAPSFGERLGYSARRGWQALESLALLLVTLWPLLLLLGVLGGGWYAWRQRPRRSAGAIKAGAMEAGASRAKSTRGKNRQKNGREE